MIRTRDLEKHMLGVRAVKRKRKSASLAPKKRTVSRTVRIAHQSVTHRHAVILARRRAVFLTALLIVAIFCMTIIVVHA